MPENARPHLGDADIIIVGGGPSGSSTALHLERLDPKLAARTIVLEKHRHPREKICGGALTLNAERIISDLDISLDIQYAPVHHVRLVYGEASFDFPEDGCAKRIIRRCDLDGLLFQTVKDRHVPTVEEIRVIKVVRRPDHLVVMTDRGHYRAKVVVSADGVHAVLRKTPGFGPGKMTRIYEAKTPADPAKEAVFTEQVLLIDLSYVREGLGGYYWDFPCYEGSAPYVSRGIVDASNIASKVYLDELLVRRGVNLEGAIRKVRPIRHFDPREHFSEPRMLFVGDAMGSDPLFAGGISQGLASGQFVAEAPHDAFSQNNLSFFSYTKEWPPKPLRQGVEGVRPRGAFSVRPAGRAGALFPARKPGALQADRTQLRRDSEYLREHSANHESSGQASVPVPQPRAPFSFSRGAGRRSGRAGRFVGVVGNCAGNER